MSGTLIALPKPHSQGQRDLILSRTNDVVFAGRRYGKTHTGVQRIYIDAMCDPGLRWWVGLGWKSASLKRAWRQIKTLTATTWIAFGEKPEKHIHESSKEVDLPNGSEIWMRTAERPDSLAGEGIKGVVLDEFTLMQELVWTEYVQATLLDYHGWAMFIGVPKGHNWGSRLWRESKTRKGWRQWHFATRDNPRLDPAEIEEIGKHIPLGLFQQEYEAKIVDHAGLVFRNLDSCLQAEHISVPEQDHDYVFGLDWGKKNDFTCIAVMNLTTRHLVELIRFNDDNYPTQLKRVKELNDLWRPRSIVAEANAMGEPLCDQLIAEGLPVRPFYTSYVSKRTLIESLQVAFENSYIQVFEDKVLLAELEEYEAKVTTQGNVRYSAPEGGHDDTVMALALAYDELKHDIGITFAEHS